MTLSWGHQRKGGVETGQVSQPPPWRGQPVQRLPFPSQRLASPIQIPSSCPSQSPGFLRPSPTCCPNLLPVQLPTHHTCLGPYPAGTPSNNSFFPTSHHIRPNPATLPWHLHTQLLIPTSITAPGSLHLPSPWLPFESPPAHSMVPN